MKKTFILKTMVMLLSMSLCLIQYSCSDGDSLTDEFTIGVPIKYQGTMTIDMNDGANPIKVTQELIITPKSQTSCQFALNNVDLFGDPDSAFDIVTENVSMNRKGDQIIYAATDNIYFDVNGTPVPVSITVSAIEDKNGNIEEVTEANVANRRNITCCFKGKRR